MMNRLWNMLSPADEAEQRESEDNATAEELTADELRRRRLARFADNAAEQLSNEAASNASPAVATAPSSPKTPVTTDQKIKVVAEEQVVQPPQPMQAVQSPKNTAQSNLTPVKKDRLDSPGSKSPKSPSSSFDRWANSTLSEILAVSMAPVKSNEVMYLADLREEIDAEDGPTLLSVPQLDRIIVARLALETHSYPNIAWLADSYGRATKLVSRVAKNKMKLEVIEKTLDVLVSYAGLVLAENDMFSSVVDSKQMISCFVDKLGGFSMSQSFHPEFLHKFVKRFITPEEQSAFIPIFAEIWNRAKAASITSAFTCPIRAFSTLMGFPELALLLVNQPYWTFADCTNGKFFEQNTIVGPLFTYSSCAEEPGVLPMFQELHNQRKIADSTLHLQNSFDLLHKALHELLFSVVRASREQGRESVLRWVAQAIESNKGRSKIQIDRNTVSGDGFMINLGAVMCIFCEPFLDPMSPKLKLIDASYFGSSARISVEDDTKVVATTDQVAAWVDRRNQNCIDNWKRNLERSGQARQGDAPPKESFGFVTELFFLTMRTFHLGLISSMNSYEKFLKSMKGHQDRIDRILAQRPQWENTPVAARAQAAIQASEGELEVMKQQRFGILAQLFNPTMLRNAARYYNLVAHWLVRIADPDNKGLPLAEPKMEYSSLPEHCFEDICTFWTSVYRFGPRGMFEDLLSNIDASLLMDFVATFVGSPSHIHNPYLRSKLADIVGLLIRDDSTAINTTAYNLFEASDRIKQFLVPSLMFLYVDVELTGSHTQFYDKFNIRHRLSSILKFLWSFSSHREAFKAESRNIKRFVQFSDHLLNDGTFLLDEALMKLEEIHSLELEMSDAATWNAQAEVWRHELFTFLTEKEVRTDREQHFSSLEGQYLSTEIVEPFMAPELIDRIALMLDSYLSALAGPRCSNLQVSNPAKYNWNPQLLLEQISDIYRHLRHPKFYEAIARDGRYYSPEIFTAAGEMLSSREWRSKDLVRDFLSVNQRVQEVKQQDELDEDALGDVPDEFLDPITCMIMRDPVILPSSKQVLDRPTIARQLLSDPTDPFNRQPLTEEELIPATELKERIADFILSKLGNR